MGNTVDHIFQEGGGATNTVSVSLASNTFTVGQWIHKDGSSFGLADSGDEATSEPLMGVVSTAGDPLFTVTTEGEATVTAHGFTVGAPLYLDASGAVTETVPTTGVYKQVGYVKDANTIFVRIGDTIVIGQDAEFRFVEYSATGDGASVNFDFATNIASQESVLVTVGGVPQSVSAYSVVADGNGDPRRIQFTEAPANGHKIVVRYLGIAKSVNPVSTVQSTDYNSGTPVALSLTSSQDLLNLKATSEFIFPHSLGTKPKDVTVVLRCLDTDTTGYSIGDEVDVHGIVTDANENAFTVSSDTTNVYVVPKANGLGNSQYELNHKTTGSQVAIDLSKWGVVVYANAEMAGSVGVIQAVNTPATEFESSLLPLGTGTTTWNSKESFVVSHGLGSKPKSVRAVFVCTTNDSGYTVGDEFEVEFAGSNSGGNSFGMFLWSSATEIGVTFRKDGVPYEFINKTTEGLTSLGLDNWALKYYANSELGGYKGDRGPAGTGKIAQVKYVQDSIERTFTSIIPHDDTKPQNTEGDELYQVQITPKNPDSTLIIEYDISKASAAGISALFRDSEVDSFFANAFAGEEIIRKRCIIPANGTNTRTYKLRLGLISAGSLYINNGAGANDLGNLKSSNMTVTEILP